MVDDWQPDRAVPLFPADIVAVWRVPMETHVPLAAEEWSTLSADERSRAERFKFDEPRIRLVRCRRALRFIMARWLNSDPAAIAFDYGEYGKPRLSTSSPALTFNVSHSHDWAVIAVTASGDLGADVERCDPRTSWPGLARRFYSQREVDTLFALAPELQLAAFYQIWTGKEAFIKAIGRGLSFSLNSFSVQGDPNQPRALLAVDEPEFASTAWQMADIAPAAEYAATVMWNGPARTVVRQHWNPFTETPA